MSGLLPGRRRRRDLPVPNARLQAGCGPGSGHGCGPSRTLLDDAIEVGAADPDAPPDAIGGQLASVDPVAHGLLIELQQLCDFGNGQELIHTRDATPGTRRSLELAA